MEVEVSSRSKFGLSVGKLDLLSIAAKVEMLEGKSQGCGHECSIRRALREL